MTATQGRHPLPGADHLPAADAAAVLREVMEGTCAVRPAAGARGLISVAVGEWKALAGDAEITFFITHASLDYLFHMRDAGGREASFTDWLARDGANPLDLLDDDERLALELRLRDAS